MLRAFNDRGVCLAGARVADRIRPGVLKLSTGAWWDPVVPGESGALDAHGYPNVLTRGVGTFRLALGCSAQSCLAQVERCEGEPSPVRAFEPPEYRVSDARRRSP